MKKIFYLLAFILISVSSFTQEVVYITQTDTIFSQYPRKDLKPINGLDKNISVYFVSYANKPTYNTYKYRLKTYGYTTENVIKDNPYPTYFVDYKLEEIPVSDVLSIYYEMLSNYFNKVYPESLKWQHSGFGNRYNEYLALGVDVSAMQPIRDSIVRYQEWITNERVYHENIIKNYKENGIFPEFNFNNKP